MNTTLIKNAKIVNEGRVFSGNLLIQGEYIKELSEQPIEFNADEVVDANGMLLIPGLIDDQVHFRQPGLTHKADIASESRAAVAGGITSFMEMPNTVPNTVSQDLLAEKYQMGAESSMANYSFFFGATNDNLHEVLKTDKRNVCGVKVFMGSSTGNMLVDNRKTLEGLFKECPLIIATHCEDEYTIQQNVIAYKERYGENVPMKHHPLIRSAEACYKSSSMAAELAHKFNARLHILHISTAKEMSIFESDKPLKDKVVTAEACVHHLWFNDSDYEEKGSFIKWNPAVKSEKDRLAVLEGLNSNKIDVLATDHAPHTLEEKNQSYFKAPSGGPLVQHALPALLEMVRRGDLTLETLVQKACHNVADLFQINKRGYLREGYFADLVLVDLDNDWEVNKDNILYKCNWSPFEGQRFHAKVLATFVNGTKVFAEGKFVEAYRGKRLTFNRD